MAEAIRGKIRNQRRARQLKDFSGLRYGNITPMDIDGIIEFSDRLFVFIEYKSEGAELEGGQRLCIARLCKAIAESGRICIAIIAEHNPDICDEIDGANATVREYFYDTEWKRPKGEAPVSVKTIVDFMHEKFVKGK
jgi:hypothetical protein